MGSLLCIALSCIPKGPSLLFHLPQKEWIFVTGLTLQGLVGAPIFVTFLADIFLTFKARYKIVEGKNPKLDLKLANLLASLGTVFYMSSPILVRSIGTWIYTKYGYRALNDVFFIFYAVCTLFYIIFYLRCSPYKDFKK